mgnify:CR=1 FL=1
MQLSIVALFCTLWEFSFDSSRIIKIISYLSVLHVHKFQTSKDIKCEITTSPLGRIGNNLHITEWHRNKLYGTHGISRVRNITVQISFQKDFCTFSARLKYNLCGVLIWTFAGVSDNFWFCEKIDCRSCNDHSED